MSGRSAADRRDRPRGGDGRVQREEFDQLRSRVASLDDLLDSTGRLALQIAHRVGTDSAKRSLVFFASGAVRQDLTTGWESWTRTSRLPPAEHTLQLPQPWKAQVAARFLAFISTQAREHLDSADPVASLAGLEPAVEAVSHGQPAANGSPWPIVVCFRNSESALAIRENLLHERRRPAFKEDPTIWDGGRLDISPPARRGPSYMVWAWTPKVGGVAPVLSVVHPSGKAMPRPARAKGVALTGDLPLGVWRRCPP